MPVRPMLELGDPRLRQPAQAVGDAAAPEIAALLDDLWATLDDFRRRRGWGRALAAPVIGVPLRVVVIAVEGRLELINPRFAGWSREQVAAYESCMTFDCIWGEVIRPARVVVVAQDRQGREQRYDATGDLARVLQHEIDHLDGLVWLDRDPDPLTICTTGEYRRRYRSAS
ncbi:peptide deformylase [Kallotenue papyrolyticum]|uniref:peptide deformylase n=1 Tax=Kallotenue papyrolyticum TaxID=1325125 RepID=UPI00047860A6|nr:peptide deformylase [Kallotenue papyrolyticum]